MISETDINDWECLPMQFLNKTKPKTWFVVDNELFMLDVVMQDMAWAYDKEGRRQFFKASMAITPIKFILKGNK
jgi:predicted glycosyltransferase involved in capsule biosynthesis